MPPRARMRLVSATTLASDKVGLDLAGNSFEYFRRGKCILPEKSDGGFLRCKIASDFIAGDEVVSRIICDIGFRKEAKSGRRALAKPAVMPVADPQRPPNDASPKISGFV